MSRVIFGFVVALILAGGLIVMLEYYKRSYQKGKTEEREFNDFMQVMSQVREDEPVEENGPVDGKA